MSTSRALLGLLLLASGLLDLALCSAVSASSFGTPTGTASARVALVSLLVSQVALMAGWSILSRAGLFWRALGLILTVVMAGQILGRMLDPSNHHLVPIWTAILYVHALAVVGIVGAARRRGMRLVVAGLVGQNTRPTCAARPQFSVVCLLGLITLVAVALGTFRYALQNAPERFPQPSFWFHAVLAGAALSLLSLTAIWALLGRDFTILSSTAMVAVLPLAGTALWFTGQFQAWPVALLLCAMQALWLAAMLLVIRVAGFRITLALG